MHWGMTQQKDQVRLTFNTREIFPSIHCHPFPFVLNWLGEISPPKQDGTPQTFCSSEEGERHPFDKCRHFVLPDVFLHPLLLSDFIFVRVRTWKMPAIVLSQLEPQPVFRGEMWWPSWVSVKSWSWRTLSSLGPFIHSTHQNLYAIVSTCWNLTSTSPLWF